MNINCGRFDRRIEIIKLKPIDGVYTGDSDYPYLNQLNARNEEILIHRVWADVKDLRAKEKMSEYGTISIDKDIKITTRYIKNIKNDMVIKYEKEYYEITSIAELGRREYIEISATKKDVI